MIHRINNRHQLPKDYIFRHVLLRGINFTNAWCSIQNGVLTVYAGYPFDGCSPKWEVCGLFTVGVPDGRLHNGVPITYFPSLVHDVFCRFKNVIPITQAATVSIFNDMLGDVDFMLRPVYVAMVNRFGPQQFYGDIIPS